MRRVIIVFVLLFFEHIFAHSDYMGDIHPRNSVVEDSFFMVKYTSVVQVCSSASNRVLDNYKWDLLYDLYALDGRKIENRRLMGNNSNETKSLNCNKYNNDSIYTFSHYWKTDSILYQPVTYLKQVDVNPSVQIIDIRQCENIGTIKLQWGINRVLFHDIGIFKEKIYILASPMKSILFFKSEDIREVLYLYVFGKNSGRMEKKFAVGKPVYIYSIPRVSLIEVYSISDNCIYFSYISTDEKLYLTQFNTDKLTMKTKLINTINEWNTTPTIAIFKNRCLIAYHTLSVKEKWDSSIVKTIFLDIDSVFKKND